MDFLSSIFTTQHMMAFLAIIWIDILLSGDNAVIIALACRNLPEKQRKTAIYLGTGVAVGLRIIFALIVTYLLQIPFLKLAGGLMLLWIGTKLAMGEDEGEQEDSVASKDNLWHAVRTIAIADAVMSLDNVIAISAASHGNIWLFVFGLLFSIPLVIAGSQLVLRLLERFPIIVWLGAALLGWIAGAMIVDDPAVVSRFSFVTNPVVHYGAAIVGAVLVVGLGWWLRQNRAKAIA